MSTVIAPFDASGIVLRQNGSSSWIDTGVGLFSPMTLNWLFGRSWAAAPDASASSASTANNRLSMSAPFFPRHHAKSAKCMPRKSVLNSQLRSSKRNGTPMSTLTLAQANKIVEVARARAREMKIKPLAVAVLDQSGHVKSLQREDGASMFRCDVAVGKAYASVGMGVASRTLLQRAKENPQFFGALSATAQGKFLPQTGAVVIKDKDGNVLGAAGASGGTGDEDEAVCIAGVEAAGLMHG